MCTNTQKKEYVYKKIFVYVYTEKQIRAQNIKRPKKKAFMSTYTFKYTTLKKGLIRTQIETQRSLYTYREHTHN